MILASFNDFIKNDFILHPDVIYASHADGSTEIVLLDGGHKVTLQGVWSELPDWIIKSGNFKLILDHLILEFTETDHETLTKDLLAALYSLFIEGMIINAERNPKITFVIPAYNAQNTIEATLESIFKQDSPYPYEVIVVDNNSLDDTIIHASGFPVIILREFRRSRSFARNRGLRAARGEFIAFVDSDVTLTPCWTREVLNGFEIEQISAVQSRINFRAISAKGALKELFHSEHERKLRYPNAHRLPIPFFDTAAVMLRRAFLIENNIRFDTRLFRAEDVDLSYQVLQAGGSLAYVDTTADKDLGHNSILKILETTFKQGFWDRISTKKWLPSLGFISPARWQVNIPGIPLPKNTTNLLGIGIQLSRWFGWWCAILLESFSPRFRIIGNGTENSIKSNPLFRFNREIRIIFTPESARIVEWNEKALFKESGLTVNQVGRDIILSIASGKDKGQITEFLINKYSATEAQIKTDFANILSAFHQHKLGDFQ